MLSLKSPLGDVLSVLRKLSSKFFYHISQGYQWLISVSRNNLYYKVFLYWISGTEERYWLHVFSYVSHAQAFGFLSCILFVVDMVLNYNEFQTQRAQETSPDQGQQGPPQRRVWDINYEYLHSPLFNIKLAEVVGNLCCSVKYYCISYQCTFSSQVRFY